MGVSQTAGPRQVLEAVPGEGVAIRWNPPPGLLPGLLEITTQHHDGQTVVKLVNFRYPGDAAGEDECQGVVSGWAMALESLMLYLENYLGRSGRCLTVLRPASFTYQQLALYSGVVNQTASRPGSLRVHRKTRRGLMGWPFAAGADDRTRARRSGIRFAVERNVRNVRPLDFARSKFQRDARGSSGDPESCHSGEVGSFGARGNENCRWRRGA